MTCKAGTIHEQIEINVERLQTIFTHAPDLVIRSLELIAGPSVVLVYLEGLVDMNSINQHVIRPLLDSKSHNGFSLPRIRKSKHPSKEPIRDSLKRQYKTFRLCAAIFQAGS